MIKVSAALIRDVVKALDALENSGVELLAGKPAKFFSLNGRLSEEFRITLVIDGYSGELAYEVTL